MAMPKTLTDRKTIKSTVTAALADQPIIDMHTHLYPPTFGTPVTNATGQSDPAGLMLWSSNRLPMHGISTISSPLRSLRPLLLIP